MDLQLDTGPFAENLQQLKYSCGFIREIELISHGTQCITYGDMERIYRESIGVYGDMWDLCRAYMGPIWGSGVSTWLIWIAGSQGIMHICILDGHFRP